MTKTMEINELVRELKEYDGELTVKVWSNGAEKPYPISHVGQGHTDGVLDTMGEFELSKNEKFVCTFSSFLVDPIEEIVKANKMVHLSEINITEE